MWCQAIKDNQPTLRADIAELFAPTAPLAKGFNTGPTDFRRVQTVIIGHGRNETRVRNASSLLGGLSDCPGLAQATMRHGVVYGVTTLTPAAASPTCLLELVRQLLGIENGLHYRRDVTFHEDAGRTKNWNLAHALATIHNLLLTLLIHLATPIWPRLAAIMPPIPLKPGACSWPAQHTS